MRFSPMLKLFPYMFAACFLLAGCAENAMDGNQQRGQHGSGKIQSDEAIKSKIMKNFAAKGEVLSQVAVDVSRGRVLLSGEVLKPQTRIQAIDASWKTAGVKEVISEIEIEDLASFNNFAQDVVIVAQARAKLLHEKKITPSAYTIDSINGVVYLMGISDSQEELNRVEYVITRVQGVKKVVNRVTVRKASS